MITLARRPKTSSGRMKGNEERNGNQKKWACAIHSLCVCVCACVWVWGCDDTTENDPWLLWCHVWESDDRGKGRRECRRYKKAWMSVFCGLDCFPLVPVCDCMCVCVCAWLCKCMCTGADDRGHGLHTRGTANEKEAFPLTFHGSQKQFAQWKVAKQPHCSRVELGGRGGKNRHKFFISTLLYLLIGRNWVQYLTIKQTTHDGVWKYYSATSPPLCN